jgi:cytoplasmic tRNA 2-thiolation protein 2
MFFADAPNLHQMRDGTAQIREAVARYEGFEFLPVRIQDAFDRSWWERVSGGAAPSPAELPVDLDGEGLSDGSCDKLSKSLTLMIDPGPTAALQAHLRSLPTATAVLSTLSTLTRLLLLYTAYSIGASHLALGMSLTSLSISLISSISQGGGFVVPQAIQEEWIPPFVEHVPGATSWKGEVRLIRPLRDAGMKECTAWVWWHQLSVVEKQRISISERTIGKLTKGSDISASTHW